MAEIGECAGEAERLKMGLGTRGRRSQAPNLAHWQRRPKTDRDEGVSRLALLTPSLLWAKAAWLSPFLRTQRHGPSGALSLVSGGLMFAAFNIDGSIRISLFGASTLALAAMFAALFWPKRGVR